MESNHRFLDVNQASLPLDHGTVFHVFSVDPPGIAPGSPACDTGIFLLDDEPIWRAKVRSIACPQGLEP